MDRTDSGADTALKTRVHEFIYNFHQGSEYIQGVGMGWRVQGSEG